MASSKNKLSVDEKSPDLSRRKSVYDYLFKITLTGDSHVGKSSIMQRFSKDEFKDEWITTIGVDFALKTINVDGKIVKLQVWDTAGQERFRSITSAYYRGANAMIICYAINDIESFENVRTWWEECNKHCKSDCIKFIVGTKIDREDQREVTTKSGQQLSKELGARFVECSSKSGWNIPSLFDAIARYCIQEKDDATTDGDWNKVKLDKNNNKGGKKKKCC